MIEFEWSTISNKSILGILLRFPLKLIPSGTVVTVLSGINKGRKWIVGAAQHGNWLGGYELEMQKFVERMLKPGMTAFDVGANVGFYTLAFSRLVGTGHVWSFEPLAGNMNSLLKHVNINNVSNVTLIQAAVSDSVGMAGFRIAQSNAMGSIGENDLYQVPTINLDSFMDKNKLKAPDFLKMDIEGGEILALKGAKNLLSQKKTIVFLSLHGEVHKVECRKILLELGYDLYRINGDKIEREDQMISEIFALPK